MVFGIKTPRLSLQNHELLVLGGSAILVLASAIQLHNNWPGIVPTVPGLYYGSGGPATGIYTGASAPYSPVPGANQIYQSDVRPYTTPVTSAIETQSQKLGLLGISSGDVGRGGYRDLWTDVYDPSKTSASVTGDDPTKRFTLA